MTVEGSLRVNGALVGDAGAMAAMSGYVQQDDAFVPMLTVREHLWFHAMLRMDEEVPDEERNMKIDEIIREVRRRVTDLLGYALVVGCRFSATGSSSTKWRRTGNLLSTVINSDSIRQRCVTYTAPAPLHVGLV